MSNPEGINQYGRGSGKGWAGGRKNPDDSAYGPRFTREVVGQRIWVARGMKDARASLKGPARAAHRAGAKATLKSYKNQWNRDQLG